LSQLIAGFRPMGDEFEVADLDESLVKAQSALKQLRGASLFLTGGTGFFGRRLLAMFARANTLLGLELEVAVLTRSAARFSAQWPQLAAAHGQRLVEGDVRFFEFPKGRFTHVIHAAGDTSLAADNRPLELLETIVNGTRRVLDFALMSGVRRVLMVSSGAVYGAVPAGMREVSEGYVGAGATTDRRSVYGQAKRLAEQLTTIYAAENGLSTVIARAFAFVGPGLPLDAHFAIGNFIREAVAGRTIVVRGDGRAVRSYLYSGDLAAWLARLLVDGTAGTAYNVGSDRAVSIGELAALVSAAVPQARGFAVEGLPDRDFRSHYVPSIARARAELGLDVWTPLNEAIRRTACWASMRGPGEQARDNVAIAGNEQSQGVRSLTFVVDIDGVVASLTAGNDYARATPLTSTILLINRLFDAGHRIIMFTARGSATGVDWSECTRAQLAAWGLKYHDLRFGKPAGDYYIDDRIMSVGELARMVDAAST